MSALRITIASLFLLCAACSGDDDGSPPSPDADPTQPDADPGATLEFMSTCDIADDRCDTANGDFCFAFNSKGPHCTRSCSDAADCPAPSTGCNNQGVCKAP